MRKIGIFRDLKVYAGRTVFFVYFAGESTNLRGLMLILYLWPSDDPEG